jgi:hypothetical protein
VAVSHTAAMCVPGKLPSHRRRSPGSLCPAQKRRLRRSRGWIANFPTSVAPNSILRDDRRRSAALPPRVHPRHRATVRRPTRPPPKGATGSLDLVFGGRLENRELVVAITTQGPFEPLVRFGEPLFGDERDSPTQSANPFASISFAQIPDCLADRESRVESRSVDTDPA